MFLNLFYNKKRQIFISDRKKRSRKYHVSCLVQLERLAQYLHCTAHCSCLEFILQNDESRQIFPHFWGRLLSTALLDRARSSAKYFYHTVFSRDFPRSTRFWLLSSTKLELEKVEEKKGTARFKLGLVSSTLLCKVSRYFYYDIETEFTKLRISVLCGWA